MLSARGPCSGLPASLHFAQASLLALQRVFSWSSLRMVSFSCASYGVEGELQPQRCNGTHAQSPSGDLRHCGGKCWERVIRSMRLLGCVQKCHLSVWRGPSLLGLWLSLCGKRDWFQLWDGKMVWEIQRMMFVHPTWDHLTRYRRFNEDIVDDGVHSVWKEGVFGAKGIATVAVSIQSMPVNALVNKTLLRIRAGGYIWG